MGATVLTAIARYVEHLKETHNDAEFLSRWNPDMETQINVSGKGGKPVEGHRFTYSNGSYKWWNIRIPRNADSNPNWDDYELTWPPEHHTEGIGSTGWDWKNKRSRWVGFDFDAITGHSKGIGISDAELHRIRMVAEEIPYIETRRSTSGTGLHLYCLFDDTIQTDNHTEHAALARCILGLMSSETGFDFATQIDVCGGNMWMWHKKMSESNHGFELLHPSTKKLGLSDLPGNWRDHVDVIKRTRNRIKISGVPDGLEQDFENLTSSRRITPLDDSHRAVIDELTRSGFTTVWVSDHHLLQTHTCAFKQLMQDNEKVKRLKLKGVYETTSLGTDKATPNCYAFPEPHGAWKITRFGQGNVHEAETWENNSNGFTTCDFNVTPTVRVACLSKGGVETAYQKGYLFDTTRHARETIELLGGKVEIPDRLAEQPTTIRPNTDGKTVLEITNPGGDKADGWDGESKKGKLIKVINTMPPENRVFGTDICGSDYDYLVRALVTPAGQRTNWVLKTEAGWNSVPKEDIRSFLISRGMKRSEAEEIIGSIIARPWTVVSIPFGNEYPGNRQWNQDAPQFRYQPSNVENPHHPTWDQILHHIGDDLDKSIRRADWSDKIGIESGYKYLLCWLACAFRDPFEPLPYLFLFGPQNSGKSILWEAGDILITRGVVAAERTLRPNQEFNGELANAVLCVVEETDLQRYGPGVYDKLKEFVTAKKIPIRKMRHDVYMVESTCKFIQCAQKKEYVPVFPGDTRVTMTYVPELVPSKENGGPEILPEGRLREIPKTELMEKLRAEAPDFMTTLMRLDLPPAIGRLRIPVVDTDHKAEVENHNRDAVDMFLTENCYEVPGEKISFTNLYENFVASLPANDKGEFSKKRFRSMLPDRYPIGTQAANKLYVGNISFHDVVPTKPELYVDSGKLKHKRG